MNPATHPVPHAPRISPRRRTAFRSLLILAAVGVLLLAARPVSAAPPSPLPANLQPEAPVAHDYVATGTLRRAVRQPVTGTCDDALEEGERLAQEPVELNAPGPGGSPVLCLLLVVQEDVFDASLVPVVSAEQFRAAKVAALQVLQSQGIDLCRIGRWTYVGPNLPELLPDDFLNLPVECRPRLISLPTDSLVGEVMPQVAAATDRVLDQSAEQLAWKPNRPLTIIATMDLATTIATYQRYIPGLPPDEVARRAQDGRSVSVGGTPYGGLILLNLVGVPNLAREADQSAGTIAARLTLPFLAHEYTHFATGSIGGSPIFFPMWYVEGLGQYQEIRLADLPLSLLDDAIQAQLSGKALRLADLATREDWFRHEAQDGSDAVYSRAYAAVSYLAERHGFAATVKLLRDNHNGSITRFNEALKALTGMDLDALDAALGVWLAAAAGPRQAAPTSVVPRNVRFSGGDAGGVVQIAFTTNADGTAADGVLVANDLPCGSGRVVSGEFDFLLRISTDGLFTATSASRGALVTFEGRIYATGEARGTLRYQHNDSGCDTGLIAWVAQQR